LRGRVPLPAWIEHTEGDSDACQIYQHQETAKVIPDVELRSLADDPEEAFVEFELLASSRLETALNASGTLGQMPGGTTN